MNVDPTKGGSEKFTPQIGVENIMGKVAELIQRNCGGISCDAIGIEVTRLMSLFVTIREASSTNGVISASVLYMSSFLSENMLKKARSYLNELFDPQLVCESDWREFSKSIQVRWRRCVDNVLFAKFSRILSLVVTVGLCKLSDVSFSFGKFKMFVPKLLSKQSSAIDLIEAVADTMMYFIDRMIMCFRDRSLMPFLLTDSECMSLDERYAQIRVDWKNVQCGNYVIEGVDSMEAERQFQENVESIASEYRKLLETVTGFERKCITINFQNCLSIINEYSSFKVHSGVRPAPFGICFYGGSSVGKTTCATQVVDYLFLALGLNCDRSLRANFNSGDKFVSNWKTNMLAMNFDDIANDKSNFVERAPTRALIDFINNQSTYVNTAELESKGNVFVEPAIVTATTNKQDMDAGVYSNCPFSIQRRMYSVKVEVKRQFQKVGSRGLDPEKVVAFYTRDGVHTPEELDDVWKFTLQEAVEPKEENLRHIATYRVVHFHGRKMENVNIYTLCKCLTSLFRKHRITQNSIVKRNREVPSYTVCSGCNELQRRCRCLPPFDQQIGLNDVRDVANVVGDEFLALVREARSYLTFEDHALIRFVPDIFVYNPLFNWLVVAMSYSRYYCVLRNRFIYIWTCFGITSAASLVSLGPFCVMPIVAMFICAVGMTVRIARDAKRDLLEFYKSKRVGVSFAFKAARESVTFFVLCVVADKVLRDIILSVKGLNNFYAQGNLVPRGPDDIAQRDMEENVWAQPRRIELPISKLSRTVTPKVLEGVVSKNQIHVTMRKGGHGYDPNSNAMVANAFFLCTGVIVLPTHYFDIVGGDEGIISCVFRRHNPGSPGGTFRGLLERSSSIPIICSDLSLCYIGVGGSYRDLTKHLALDSMPSTAFKMCWRSDNGEIVNYTGIADSCVVKQYKNIDGGVYSRLSSPTFTGMCGATLVSQTQGSVIMGFHVAGTSGRTRGCYASLTQEQCENAIQQLSALPGVLLTGNADKFEEQIMGKKFLVCGDIHKKSPLNYMPEGSQICFHGLCIGRSTARSDACVTIISDTVGFICNYPNVFCPPKFQPDWFGFQKCLENLSIPANPFPYHILCMAVRDYAKPLLEHAEKDFWKISKPLTHQETINGRPGCRFIDRMKTSTSIGFPLNGKKSDWLHELDPDDEYDLNYEFDQEILLEIDRCHNLYKEGKRAWTIAKACKKDEILDKEKCRIFYACGISLTYWVRRYFLPILRFLQMNPITSECAVGVNCHGPEWSQLYGHMVSKGTDRLLAGDYSKYDQKIPSQLMLAALRIMIDIARKWDYGDEDIRVMEAMSGDIVYALVAFDGQLISLMSGGHISGIPLTAVLNGIVGSLNLRAVYYTRFVMPLPFRTNVSLVTYGDDNAGSVDSSIAKEFNIEVIHDILGSYGQTYTMPDKESEITAFLPLKELEFLKRFNSYIPEIYCNVGALNEKSIFKSLHYYLRPKGVLESENVACALNIDGALREWFNHGRDIYELRRSQLKEVALKHDISGFCAMLNKDFDELALDWLSKYGGKDSL